LSFGLACYVTLALPYFLEMEVVLLNASISQGINP